MKNKLHIKLDERDTSVIMNTAKLLRMRPEDLVRQAAVDASLTILESMKKKLAELKSKTDDIKENTNEPGTSNSIGEEVQKEETHPLVGSPRD